MKKKELEKINGALERLLNSAANPIEMEYWGGEGLFVKVPGEDFETLYPFFKVRCERKFTFNKDNSIEFTEGCNYTSRLVGKEESGKEVIFLHYYECARHIYNIIDMAKILNSGAFKRVKWSDLCRTDEEWDFTDD